MRKRVICKRWFSIAGKKEVAAATAALSFSLICSGIACKFVQTFPRICCAGACLCCANPGVRLASAVGVSIFSQFRLTITLDFYKFEINQPRANRLWQEPSNFVSGIRIGLRTASVTSAKSRFAVTASFIGHIIIFAAPRAGPAFCCKNSGSAFWNCPDLRCGFGSPGAPWRLWRFYCCLG